MKLILPYPHERTSSYEGYARRVYPKPLIEDLVIMLAMDRDLHQWVAITIDESTVWLR